MAETAPSTEFAAARLRSQEGFEGFVGVSVTIAGSSYTAAVVEGVVPMQLADGGFGPVGTITIRILKSALAAIPARGAIAVYDSRRYALDPDQAGGLSALDKVWVLRGRRV